MSLNQAEDPKFYENAENYWKEVSPTVNGMLGGFEKVSDADIKLSTKLLNYLMENNIFTKSTNKAIDCGAGIGRVTKNLLMPMFDNVEMVEVTKHFLDESHNYIGHTNKTINRICCPLQNFTPDRGQYDLIWCQWVTGHLTDEAFVGFLKRCADGLHSSLSVIVIKENVVKGDQADFDTDDSSFTRPIALLKELFDRADLELIHEQRQTEFPKELYPVWMFVLKPKPQRVV